MGQSGVDAGAEQAYQGRIAEPAARLTQRDATVAALQQRVAMLANR